MNEHLNTMRLVKPNPTGQATLDDLFVEKYEWLMRWALYFAQGERATAEDLVQDTFVRFAISHPELDHAENAEKLLYKYLKYVHHEHLYRVQKYPLQNLSIDEFDSLSAGLRQNPSVNPIDIQNTLRRVLKYLCWRKESTKTASILILRFFYGYFPEEIMRIGILSRPNIDNGLRAARMDLKRHFVESASGCVRPVDEKAPPVFVPASKAAETDDFIAELRVILLDSCRGDCQPVEELTARYEAEFPKPLECELLAHVVSCRRCLDIVTHSRKLPLLGERSFESALVERHDSKPPASGGERDKSIRRSLKMVHDRIEENLEHQPRSLSLVVNGHVLATQEVNSAVSRLELDLNIGGPIELIEIISEQGFCLFGLPVDEQPPEVSPEIYRLVQLRGGRTVEAWLRFTSMGPRIETLYCDPALAALSDDAVEDRPDEKASQPSGSRSAIPQEQDRLGQVEGSTSPLQSSVDTKATTQYAGAAFDSGASPTTTPVAATTLFAGNPEGGTRASAFSAIGHSGSLSALWFRFLSFLLRCPRPSMNPLLATALSLAVASVVFLALWWQQPLRITANSLLVHAEAWDAGGQRTAMYGVIYQRVSVKAPGYSATRAVYRDAQGIRRPKSGQSGWADEALKYRLAASGVDWEAPLSATTYQDWHDHQRVREDSITRDGAKLIKLTTMVPSGAVRKESLTVRISDFHPVERTVEFDNNETIEIAELDYSVLPWDRTTEGWFEPVAASSLAAPHPSPYAAILPRLLHLPSDSELDEAEIEARLALHRLDADSNERIAIDRSAKGVQVKGVVATLDRKHEIEACLHPIPYVFPSIFTFDELAARPDAAGSVTSIKSSSVSETISPLNEYLANRGMSHSEIVEMSSELSDTSVSVSQESKAVADLLTEFGLNKQLSPVAQAALDQLLAEHKAKILSSLKSEEQLLDKMGVSQAPANGNDADSQLMSSVERHRALANELLSENNPHSRSAQRIVLELDQSLHRLRSIVESLSAPLPVSALSSPPSSNQNKK